MKNILIVTACITLIFAGCKKSGTTTDDSLFTGTVVTYLPTAVTKTNSKKIFTHLMPWFETNQTNGGVWGSHWTMTNQNPNIVDGTGKRQIASHFYPLIGPYASGDTMVIEYQLLLMKLSGIDGVWIDWPGRQNALDFPYLARNSERVVKMMERIGLHFAIVYEDQNLSQVGSDVNNRLTQAKADMSYLQSSFFSKSYYEKLNDKPLLLVFGPQILQNESSWTDAFSVLNPKPSFFTLWYESGEAGTNATGEFAWIYQNHLNDLNGFYNNSYGKTKIASAYPGFKTFYAQGGTGGPTWEIPHNNFSTFETTLDLALSKSYNYVQLNTWNDYGEGTIIEPTREFGYGFLTILQNRLGVSSLSQTDLELVNKLFEKRKANVSDATAQKKLDQVFYYIVSLQMDKAKKLLDSI